MTLTCVKVPYFVEKCYCKICILTCGNGIFGVLGVFAGYFHKDLVQKTLEDYICPCRVCRVLPENRIYFDFFIQW